MKISVKTGIVVLLLVMLIPLAMSVASSNGLADNSNPSAAVVQTAPPTGPVAPTITPSAKSYSPVSSNGYTNYGYSNGQYLWYCCIDGQYSWGTTTYIPVKVELWDNKGAPVSRATVVAYTYWYNYTSGYWTYYTSQTPQSTGDNGLDAKLLYTLPAKRYWYTFIEGYYYDPNNNFRYAYQQTYFYT